MPDASVSPHSTELRSLFGELDIYLFDQLLKGRFDRRDRVLDAGCGDGRNLVYLLQRGAECYGVDRDASAIAAVRRLAATHAPALPESHFRVADLTRLPFADGSMDAVICSAVLHFAEDEAGMGSRGERSMAGARIRRPLLRPSGLEYRPRVAAGTLARAAAAPRRQSALCRD